MTQAIIDEFLEHHGDDELEHYGVKGMKWGVRKDRRGRVKARATLGKRDREDSEWLDSGTNRPDSFNKAYNKTYRNAAGKIRQGIRKVNSDPKYKNQDFRHDSPLRKEYYKAISEMSTKQLNASASKKGVSPNGRFELNFDFDISREAKPTVTVRRRDTRKGRGDTRSEAKDARRKVQHDTDDEGIKYTLEVDEMGYIQDINIPDDITHAQDVVDDFLEHHGIKGMKWGVRRSDAQLRAARKQRKSESPGGSDSRGEKKTARIGSDPIGSIRKTNVKKLSDEDLRAGLERLQMEKRYRDLARPEVNAGQKMVKDILIKAGTQVATAYAVHYLGKGAAKLTKVDLKIGVNEKEKEKKDQKKDDES